MSTHIIKDGSIAGQVPEIPAFRTVSAGVFTERAERFRALAPGHALQAYLDFAATVEAYHFLVPQRRYGEPREIADAAVFLASSESDYVNGHNLASWVTASLLDH